MRKKIFNWLGREFVALSAEAKSGASAKAELQELLERFGKELSSLGLSLDHTVRTRLWGRDRESRNQGGEERVRILSGKARSASSSYIAPVHFDSDARVALDLLAMKPSRPGAVKTLREYEPQTIPLRYLVYDSVVVLSGVTVVLPTLGEQLDNIIPRISASLAEPGASWEQVAKVSFYLHRSQNPEYLKDQFRERVPVSNPQMEYSFVDGYSLEGKLVEVEVTARLP